MAFFIGEKMSTPQINKKKKDMGATVFLVTVLTLPIIAFLFFYVYINFNSILMAFQVPLYDGRGGYKWGLDNFAKVLKQFTNTEENLLVYLRNTFLFFVQDTFINLPLSLIICYFIYKKIACHKLLRVVIYLPIIITSTIFATLFKGMIEAGGPLRAIADKFGFSVPGSYVFNEQHALKTVLFYSIYANLGARFILFGGAMNAIDPNVIDAGKIDGVGPWRELVSIIMPIIWPTLGTMVLLASAGVFTASGPSLLFDKGEYGSMTISYWIYDITAGSGSSGESHELASAIGLIFTILGLPIVFIVKKLTGITEDK